MDEVDLGEAPVALPHAEPMSLVARLQAGKLAAKAKKRVLCAVAEKDTFLEDPVAWEKAQERLESTHQWVRGELDDVPLTPGLVCSPRKRSVYEPFTTSKTTTAWRVMNEDGSPGKVLKGVSDARKWAASFRLRRGPLPVAAAALLGPPLSASQERAQHCGLLAHAVPAYDQATAARDARKVAAHHALAATNSDSEGDSDDSEGEGDSDDVSDGGGGEDEDELECQWPPDSRLATAADLVPETRVHGRWLGERQTYPGAIEAILRVGTGRGSAHTVYRVRYDDGDVEDVADLSLIQLDTSKAR
jgi:hypothetical protein